MKKLPTLLVSAIIVATAQGCAYFDEKLKTADTHSIEKRLETTSAEIEKLYASIQKTLEILMRHEAVIRELEAAIESEKENLPVPVSDISRGISFDGGSSSRGEKPVGPAQGLPAIPNNPGGLYEQALAFYEKGHYHDAIALFDNFTACFPNHDLADNALYWKGECFYTLRMYETSIRIFENVAVDHPTGNKVPDSLLKIGLARLSLNEQGTARSYLEKVIDEYPDTRSAEKATETIGKIPSGK